jgi:hypothetical protein
MNVVLTRDVNVAKKKSVKPAKQGGTLIRVSDEFAAAIRDVIGVEHMSTADWLDKHQLASVRKRYREVIARINKEMEDEG